jgi:hypothetical protein
MQKEQLISLAAHGAMPTLAQEALNDLDLLDRIRPGAVAFWTESHSNLRTVLGFLKSLALAMERSEDAWSGFPTPTSAVWDRLAQLDTLCDADTHLRVSTLSVQICYDELVRNTRLPPLNLHSLWHGPH